MSFIDDLAADRQMFLDGLERNKQDINLRIFEDFYPDKAHFVYELLQNAEDTGATEAAFALTADAVAFEHNGHPFTEGNVRRITGIGISDKKDQEDKIGRFGIGFKAVFAYTETPYIWSRTYSFKISDFVLPTALSAKSELGDTTRFEFPFNNARKPAPVAYEEIKAKLEGLAETTLLFLSNLRSITWHIGSEASGGVLRVQHSEHHVEVLKEVGPKMTASSHFLHFSAPIEELPGQTVSVALPLGFLPNVHEFDPAKPISQQLKIVPTTGRVAVYFPAEKETSGLRFHLHAPFVPELSRASIKDTKANEPLFRQLSKLTADSLHAIRDLGLLTGEFLGVLPNPKDSIPARYQPIHTAIVEEMKDHPLTPTYSKSHAPAKCLLQAKASLKDLLTEEDLCFLVDKGEKPHRWAIAATQRNSNQDHFLEGLDMTVWDIAEFVDRLVYKSSKQFRSLDSPPFYTVERDPTFFEWLAAKPLAWHQQLYSLLYVYYKGLEWDYQRESVKSLPIIRLGDGSYSVGDECFFPSDGIEHDPMLPRVDAGVYTSGKNTTQQEEVRKLLVEMGVREVGETEQIESILEQRYTKKANKPDDKAYLADLERFMAFVQKDPTKSSMFQQHCIFKRSRDDWAEPERVFLDTPYGNSGLTAYYDALVEVGDRAALSDWYRGAPITKEQLRQFAQATGAQYELSIREITCDWNDAKDYLYGAAGERQSSHGVNRDYNIPWLHKIIEARNVEISRLIWVTMCRESSGKLEAEFRRSRNTETRRAPSLLVNWLVSRAWVPQEYGQSVEFVKPSEASRYLLPSGFPFDAGHQWLKAVRFGENERQRSEEHQKKQTAARELGFNDEEALQDGQWFAEFDREKRQRFKREIERWALAELPDQDPKNPERRAERVRQEAADALERLSENRIRSVSVGVGEVKQEAEQYLRQQYTNPDGEMICQVCKAPLPFKLDDGSYYVEKVEFLPELQRRHYQNYLALCPLHGAMYQHANGSRDLMREMFMALEGNKLEVVLARADDTIYFTKTHIADLRAVIEADGDTVPSDDG